MHDQSDPQQQGLPNADPGLGTDDLALVPQPPEQRRVRWGDIMTIPERGSGMEPRLEARVLMYPDKSRFFVHYPSGKEEILSAAQFVAFVLELKRSHRFSFDRRR